jgi:hypothetical protein
MTGTLQRILLASGGGLAAATAATTLVVVTASPGGSQKGAQPSGSGLSEVVLRPDSDSGSRTGRGSTTGGSHAKGSRTSGDKSTGSGDSADDGIAARPVSNPQVFASAPPYVVPLNQPAVETGAQGPAGPSGLPGQDGAQGAAGTTGGAGADGTNGKDGATGAAGATGAQGTNDFAGATGATGAQGAAGATGATGAQGPTGPQGPVGATGADGANGQDGQDGQDGAAGATGATGAAGADGQDGQDGAQGATGPQGPIGPTGPGGPTTVWKTNVNDSTTSTTLGSATGLDLPVAANTTYSFDYYILFQSANTNTGISLALTGPAGPALVSYVVDTPIGADGAGGLFSGWGTAYDDQVVGTAVQAANTTYVARIHGVVRTGATAGNLTPRFRTETGTSVSIRTYSWGALYTP